MTTVGLSSVEREEYRLARELERESRGARVDGRVVTIVGEDEVTGVVLRLRDDASSRLLLVEPYRQGSEVVASVVADRVDFERDRGEDGDKVVGEGKNSDELEVSR